ncbi:MAG TPA: TonB-dependent receptor, partial [Rubricoccaceae bacterium]
SGVVSGRITERGTGVGIPGATVVIEGTNFGTAAATDGSYRFSVTEGAYTLRISSLGYSPETRAVTVRRRTVTTVDVALRPVDVETGAAEVEGERVDPGPGVTAIDPRVARAAPTPLADITRSVQTELGVTSNNELSNAFSVRGGSYDENQFFIDGFEIYRPLRISQGEQEGLGLINGDLTDRLTLFAGGFPVRYGGKLASVLDATYARPAGAFAGTAYTSTLDAGARVQGRLGRGIGLAVAARSARPQRFFSGQELEGTYDPDFRDVQGVLDMNLGARNTLRIDGLYARHRFRLSPQQRETTFGIFPNLVQTVAIDYEGEEVDGYDIAFGGALLRSTLGAVVAEHRVSVFETREFERLDVTSRTSLFRRQQRPEGSQVELDRLLEGTTQQVDVADNRINQTVLTAQGRYLADRGRHGLELGWQARGLRFSDRLRESTVFRGRNAQGLPDSVTARRIVDDEALNAVQGALWVEDAVSLSRRVRLVPGLRADYFDYNRELTLSPRLTAVFRADTFTTWTAGLGVYHQAPTYRELRGDPAQGDSTGRRLTGDIASPRSLQAVLGFERFFPARRFSLRAEAYAKQFTDLISYDVENIRVNYSGENDSRGYATGVDVQLRGELVPGLASWVNYGFLITKERFTNAPDRGDFAADSAGGLAFDRALDIFTARGGGDYVRRPTDRRHNLTFFVQDNIPGDDTWTLHVRTLLGSGIPVTAPRVNTVINQVTVFEPGPRNQQELPSYIRFDMGATKRLRVGTAVAGGPLTMLATVEVLNVFDQTNVIAQSYVEQNNRGVRSFLAVPTRLTPRTINVRVRMDF